MLYLGCSLQVTITISLQTVGGATSSIFPRVEALLLNNTDYQEALEFVAARKKMEKYHSMIDFLFCEIFTEYQLACFHFYNGRGHQLHKMISPVQKFHFEQALLKALEIAHATWRRKKIMSWKKIQTTVQEMYEAA